VPNSTLSARNNGVASASESTQKDGKASNQKFTDEVNQFDDYTNKTDNQDPTSSAKK
jgi:hypothetical protein